MTTNPNAQVFIEYLNDHGISLYKIAKLSGLSDGTLRAFRDIPGRNLSFDIAVKVANNLCSLTGEPIDVLYMFSGGEQISEPDNAAIIMPPRNKAFLSALSKSGITSGDELSQKTGVDLNEIDALSQGKLIPHHSAEAIAKELNCGISDIGVGINVGMKEQRPIKYRVETLLPHDLPIRATRPIKGIDGFTFGPNAVEFTSRPPALIDEDGAFALFVIDDTMAPRLERGEVIYIHPSIPPASGNDALIEIKRDEDTCAKFILARLVSFTEEEVTLKRYLPDETFSLARSKISSITKVLSSYELMKY